MKLLFELKKYDLLTWLCFLSLCVFSNYFILNIGQSDRTLPFNAAAIFSASLVIVCGLGIVRRTNKIVIPSFFKVSFISVIIMIMPLIFMKSDFLAFIPRMLMLGFCLVFFISLYQFKVKLKHILVTIFLAGIVQAIWGGVQFLYLDYPPYGIFQQVNVYGSFMAMSLAVSGFLASRRLSRSLGVIIGIYPLVAIYLLYYAGSRVAFIGAILSTLFLLPLLWRNLHRFSVKLWSITFVVGWGVVLFPNYISDESSLIELSDTSISIEGVAPKHTINLMSKTGREYIYPQVLKLASENIWTGIGFERFTDTYIRATGHWYKEGVFSDPGLHNMDHPHSELLFWLIEGGVISQIGLLSFISLVLYRIWKCPLGYRSAFLALITPISLHIVLEYPIYHSFIHLVAILLLLFIVDKYSRGKFTRKSTALNYSLVVTQVSFLCVALLFLVSVSYANILIKNFVDNKDVDPVKLEFLHDNWLLGFRYNVFYQDRFIKNAINSRSESKVREYISWAEDENHRRPFVSHYRYLIFAYTALGELKNAEDIKSEADVLYPKFGIKNRVFNVPRVIKGT